MNKAVCFLLECLLREKIDGGAEICSTTTGTELELKIKGVEIERDNLYGWLRKIFQHFTIKDLPFGFFAYNEDRSEFLAVSISANQEFINYDVPLSSLVTVQSFR